MKGKVILTLALISALGLGSAVYAKPQSTPSSGKTSPAPTSTTKEKKVKKHKKNKKDKETTEAPAQQ